MAFPRASKWTTALLLAATALLAPRAARADLVETIRADGATLEVHEPAGAKAKRPTIVLVPGLGCTPADYEKLTAFLLARGFNVARFEHDGNSNLESRVWDAKLKALTDKLLAENEKAASPIGGTIDTDRLGIVGHSLGGSVATLAAARDPRFKALVVFGPGGKDESFLERARAVRGATLVIDGSLDRITPPEKNGALVAERAASGYRAHVVIKDGAHQNGPSDFDADYIRDSGRLVSKVIPFFPFVTMSYEFPIVEGVKPMKAADQQKITFSYLGPWLDRFVAGKADKTGATDGTKADREKKAGVLSSVFFSDAARDSGLPPPRARDLDRNASASVRANADAIRNRTTAAAPDGAGPGIVDVLDRRSRARAR